MALAKSRHTLNGDFIVVAIPFIYFFLLSLSTYFLTHMSSRLNLDMDTNTPTHCFHNLCQVMLDGSSNDLTKKNIEDFRVILHIIMHECSKANIEVSFLIIFSSDNNSLYWEVNNYPLVSLVRKSVDFRTLSYTSSRYSTYGIYTVFIQVS